jgi:hypothetical protein
MAIAPVQNSGPFSHTGGVVTVTMGAATTVGNLVVVPIYYGSSSTPTVVDGASNSLTLVAQENFGSAVFVALFAYIVPSGGSGTAFTATAAGSTQAAALEYSGAASPLALDGTAGGTSGAATTTTTGLQPSLTTTGAGSLLVSVFGGSSNLGGSGAFASPALTVEVVETGWFFGDGLESTGTQAPYATWATSRSWAQMTAAFRAAGGSTNAGLLPLLSAAF